MSRKKIHIDKLFRDGLKNFSLLVTDKDLDAIDDKSSVFKDNAQDLNQKAFGDFEIEVSDLDWQATKNKLDNEKLSMSKDTSVGSKFDGFEIQPDPSDWPITYDKYKATKRRRVALWWWMSTGVILLVAGLSYMIFSSNETSETKQLVKVETVAPKSEVVIPEIKEDVIKDNEISIPEIESKQDEAISDKKIISDNKQQVKTSRTITAQSITSKSPTDVLSRKLKFGKENQKLENVDSDLPKKTPTTLFHSPDILKQPDALGSFNVTDHGKENSDQSVEKDSVKEQGKEPETLTKNNINTTDTTVKKDDTNADDEPKTKFKPAKGYYLGLVNQVAYTDRYLSKTNNAFYNSIRQSADKSFMQYFGGIEFGYINEKGRLSGGVTMSKQTWSSAYKFNYRIYDSLPFYDPQGNLIGYFLTRGRDTSIDESRSITINRVEIPVEYSAFKKLNDRMQLSAGFGAVFGFNTSMKGDKILYPVNNQLSSYNRWKSFERTFTFAPSLQMGFQYRLAEKWMIQTNCMANMYANSRFKPSFNSKDYPFSIGINIKFMYLLNN